MSTQCCHKAFQLVVNSEMLYYKMDALVNKGGTDYQVDELGNHDMQHYPRLGGYSIVAGKIGNCAQQVGQAQWAYDQASVGWNTNDKSMTIRFWFWQAAAAQTTPLYLLFSSLAAQQYTIRTSGANIKMWLIVNPKNSGGLSSAYTFVADPITVSAWHHFVFTFDADTGLGVLYLDTVAKDSNTFPAGYSFRGTTFNIQDNQNVPGASSTIRVDEIAVFNSIAWDAPEIALDYNGGAGRTWPF